MNALPIFVRLDGQPVLLIGDGEAAAAKARLIAAAGGVAVRDLVPGVRLAFVALDDAADAAREAARLRAAGCLVNVVDRPALCDFTVPAIVDRAPVLVAVGTGGASASLAKALRERFEALLPGGLGAVAQAIFAARAAVAARHPGVDARRRHWDRLLAPGGALDPLRDHADPAAAIGAADAAPAVASRLIDIALTSFDPDELTLRQARALAQADTALSCRRCMPAALLDRARRDARRVVAEAPPAAPAPGLSIWLHFD